MILTLRGMLHAWVLAELLDCADTETVPRLYKVCMCVPLYKALL
jgi:hypothetical protein